MLLLEQILVLGARLDDRRHVDVVERRQQRRGVLRFLEAVRDRLAKARHLHALFVALAGGAWPALAPQLRSGRRRGVSRRLRRAERALPAHGPGRPPSAPRAAASTSSLVSRPSLPVPRILLGIDMMFEHRTADRGRKGRDRIARRRLRLAPAPAHARVPRSCGFSPAPAGLVDASAASFAGDRVSAAAASRRILVDARDHRADRDRVALVDQRLAEHTGRRRRHVDADLVRLERRDRLVRGDRLAGLLQPLRKRAFGDRFTERGNS